MPKVPHSVASISSEFFARSVSMINSFSMNGNNSNARKEGGEGNPTKEPRSRSAKMFSNSSISTTVSAAARSRWDASIVKNKFLRHCKIDCFIAKFFEVPGLRHCELSSIEVWRSMHLIYHNNGLSAPYTIWMGSSMVRCVLGTAGGLKSCSFDIYMCI